MWLHHQDTGSSSHSLFAYLPSAAGFPWPLASRGCPYTGPEEPDRRSLRRSLSAPSISPCGSFIHHTGQKHSISTRRGGRGGSCENILFHCVIFNNEVLTANDKDVQLKLGRDAVVTSTSLLLCDVSTRRFAPWPLDGARLQWMKQQILDFSLTTRRLLFDFIFFYFFDRWQQAIIFTLLLKLRCRGGPRGTSCRAIEGIRLLRYLAARWQWIPPYPNMRHPVVASPKRLLPCWSCHGVETEITATGWVWHDKSEREKLADRKIMSRNITFVD